LRKYVELQALVISTIAPHWAEYMWIEVLGKDSSIQLARWPQVPNSDRGVSAMREYVKGTSSSITSAEAQASKKMAKGKTTMFDPRKPKQLTVFVAKDWPSWQEKYVELVRKMLEENKISDGPGSDKELNAQVAKMAGKGPEMKKAVPFAKGLKSAVVVASSSEDKKRVLDERKLAFDEVDLLGEMRKGLMKTTGCKDVIVKEVAEGEQGLPPMADNAVPGQPGFLFENVEG
jgi:leucyl-tRNA synthetase